MWTGPANVSLPRLGEAPATGTLPSTPTPSLLQGTAHADNTSLPSPPGPAEDRTTVYTAGTESCSLCDVRPAENPRHCPTPTMCHQNH